MNYCLVPPSSVFLIWGVWFDVVVLWPLSPSSPPPYPPPPFLPHTLSRTPRSVSLIWFGFWCGHVLKILTDGFHNDKKNHSLVLQKELHLRMRRTTRTHTLAWKSLTAEMVLICRGCFSLTRFVVEDCHRFEFSKEFVNWIKATPQQTQL